MGVRLAPVALTGLVAQVGVCRCFPSFGALVNGIEVRKQPTRGAAGEQLLLFFSGKGHGVQQPACVGAVFPVNHPGHTGRLVLHLLPSVHGIKRDGGFLAQAGRQFHALQVVGNVFRGKGPQVHEVVFGQRTLVGKGGAQDAAVQPQVGLGVEFDAGVALQQGKLAGGVVGLYVRAPSRHESGPHGSVVVPNVNGRYVERKLVEPVGRHKVGESRTSQEV